MKSDVILKPIAHIHNDYKTKFAIPRQSGLCEKVLSEIIFEKEYRNEHALRGLDGYSHIWLIWHFSESETSEFRPTVRPPRLGGNERVGVFATRSPFRPNPIGLSCVKLERIEKRDGVGTILIVSGADMIDGTPIFDIKPYLTISDSKPDALCGFSDEKKDYHLEVVFPDELKSRVSSDLSDILESVLSGDPRPAYHNDSDREYGFEFADYEIKFKVKNELLTVTDVICK